ncbi:hypothetical protein EGR_09579 [Echinococcus granulosus]|uniref:Uncharacterized protein n=1 Tax=Echinococcus granulosus TaxID=6210 RepID=W6UAS5_ECHGR|nr:hypothetical protein EGR_09579 [Echinococcus granulosus]EUB55572.1 hypothetical protein EGR_09579 [Echinococcus granulosus]
MWSTGHGYSLSAILYVKNKFSLANERSSYFLNMTLMNGSSVYFGLWNFTNELLLPWRNYCETVYTKAKIVTGFSNMLSAVESRKFNLSGENVTNEGLARMARHWVTLFLKFRLKHTNLTSATCPMTSIIKEIIYSISRAQKLKGKERNLNKRGTIHHLLSSGEDFQWIEAKHNHGIYNPKAANDIHFMLRRDEMKIFEQTVKVLSISHFTQLKKRNKNSSSPQQKTYSYGCQILRRKPAQSEKKGKATYN